MNNNEKQSLAEKLRGWRLDLSIDGEAILKGIVCAALMIFFALLQTTLFTKFRPLGVVPDLILPLTVAVSMTEKEKWGAVFGLVGAFVIESLGGSTFTILPILYMLSGYICGILTVHYFRDSAATRALYTLVTSLLRVFFTLFAIFATTGGVTLITAFTKAAIPEFFACLLFAPLPHIAAKLCLRHFNKTRSERTH
ncbi:MAG: hypothetical protein ACI4XJ_03405 [Eubacteriales bacterium]